MEGLTKLRQSERLTQKEMAEKLDITVSSYTKLELGLRNPSFKLLKRLKKEFPSCDMNEFFQ